MVSRLRVILALPRQLWTAARLRRVTWLEPDSLAACRYPRDDKALRHLAAQDIRLLINLHQQSHSPEALARYSLTELHLPVPYLTPPTPEQLAQGVLAIEEALANGQKVAVHCAAGLGRTGTLLACYLVKRGLEPREAITRVRWARPGSVETPQQEAAVEAYAQQIGRG